MSAIFLIFGTLLIIWIYISLACASGPETAQILSRGVTNEFSSQKEISAIRMKTDSKTGEPFAEIGITDPVAFHNIAAAVDPDVSSEEPIVIDTVASLEGTTINDSKFSMDTHNVTDVVSYPDTPEINKKSADVQMSDPVLISTQQRRQSDLNAADEFKSRFSKNNYYNIRYKLSPDIKDISRVLGENGFLVRASEQDCGRRSALAEKLLEDNGISAFIVTKDNEEGIGHSWLAVKDKQNHLILIDPSCGSNYFRNEEKYNPFDGAGMLKNGYRIFDGIYNIYSFYGDRRLSDFAWWEDKNYKNHLIR